MRTLHAYFARELGKTFFMTWGALTIVVVMGGGVANVFRGENIGPKELARIFIYLVPVMATIVLPMSALFSAAITYGRASADNEITACRAAGINIHRIFAAAGVLGLVAGAVTYYSWNYWTPLLSERMEALTRRGLVPILIGEFQRNRALTYQDYVLQAEDFKTRSIEDGLPGARPGHTYVCLGGVSFMVTVDEEPIRIGTAREMIIDFDQEDAQEIRIGGALRGVRVYDVERRQFYQLEEQLLPVRKLPSKIRWKIKWQDLKTLQAYLVDPLRMPEMVDLMGKTRFSLMELFLYQSVLGGLEAQKKWVLNGPGVTYELSAGKFAAEPDTGQPKLREVRVVEQRGSEGRNLTANEAEILLERRDVDDSFVIGLELVGNVKARPLARGSSERIVQSEQETLGTVDYMAQEDLRRQIDTFDFQKMLDPVPPIALTPKLERHHEYMIDWLGKLVAKVQSEIHFRACYALGAPAAILLGAILGVILRGGQVLTAFGISCIPTAVVMVGIMLGRNIAERPDQTNLGLSVMWGAAILLYLATGFVALKVLRR